MEPLAESARQDLGDLVGRGPDSGDRTPDIWTFPRDEDEVKSILSWARRRGSAIYVRGGGSRWGEGFNPFQGGTGLMTEKLSALLDLDPDNLTATCQPGITLGKLDRLLEPEGLMIPLESPDREISTLGGTMAAAGWGPRRWRYGPLSRFVLGSSAWFPSGGGGDFGGKQVKNVSGYDVARFLCGSWGTLGVVSSLVVRLLPHPEQQQVLILEGSRPGLMRAADRAREEIYGATALEMLVGRPAGILRDDLGLETGRADSTDLLLIGLEGTERAVGSQADKSRDLASREGVEALAWLPAEPTWKAHGRITGGIDGHRQWYVSLLPRHLQRLLEAGGETNGSLGWGTGMGHLFLPEGHEGIEAEISALVSSMGGWFLSRDHNPGCSHGVGPERTVGPVWSRLKSQLDPDGMMAPSARMGGLSQ